MISSEYFDHLPTDGKAPLDKRGKRKEEISLWMRMFADMYFEVFGKSISFREKMPGALNACYWESVEESVRPKMHVEPDKEVVINHHKIMSVMEIAVMYLLPFQTEIEAERQDVNAQFAMFVALNILGSWKPENLAFLRTVDPVFTRDHLVWLSSLSGAEGHPIFSNAMMWYLFEKLARVSIDSTKAANEN